MLFPNISPADIKSANLLLTRWVVQEKPGKTGDPLLDRLLAFLCNYWPSCATTQSTTPALPIPLHAHLAPCFPCRDGSAKVGDVGMAKIMAGDYVSGVVGTLAW